MRYFGLTRVLLLVTWLGQEAVATSTPHAHRLLRAATKRADLYRRSVRITRRFEAEVGYVEEESGWAATTTFASQVKVNSQKPILNLEDVEHHLQDVQCGDGTMKLSFVDVSSARDAYYASCEHEKGGGLVVTSHEGCNREGERSVYKVHNVSFADDGEALELSVTGASWQDAFDQFDISFGHTNDNHLFRRHTDFGKIRRRRQTFNVDIPVDTPDNVASGTFDLRSELLDTTFPAESFLAGLQELVPIPQLPIEIGCKNCSTRGQLTLTQGAIKIDASQIDLIPDIFQGGDDGKEITSVVTGGFIELSATGVGARIELFARPKQSGAFEIALFPLPILGFVIPGIGKAGASFEPRIAVDFNISGFEINYGIDVAIPDNSNIRLELTNIKNSGVNGFQGSTLTPLPFNVNISNVDILLGLAFKPTIPVGFEFADKLKAEVFVTMNLPRLDARLSTNAAANCVSNSSNATTPSAPYANKTTELAGNLLSLGSLVLVEANVSLTVDVGAGLTIPLLPPPFGDLNFDANIFSTVFPLVTACVDAAKSFPLMTAVGAGNATTTHRSTTPGSNSTVYVAATKTYNLTQTYTSTVHMNTTGVAMTLSHAVVTTHIIETASKPAYTVEAIPVSSHVVATTHISVNTSKPTTASSHAATTTHIIDTASNPAHAVEPMSVSSHLIATSHVMQTGSKPAHTAGPLPVSSHVIATTHIIASASKPAHTAESMVTSSHVIATSHIIQTASKPAHTALPMSLSSHIIATTHTLTNTSKPTTTSIHTTQLPKPAPFSLQIQSDAIRNSTSALSIPFSIPSALSSSTITPALSTALAPSTSTTASPVIPVLPEVVMSTGFSNTSNTSAQQTGPAIFTGTGVRGVDGLWTIIAFGTSVLSAAMVLL